MVSEILDDTGFNGVWTIARPAAGSLRSQIFNLNVGQTCDVLLASVTCERVRVTAALSP